VQTCVEFRSDRFPAFDDEEHVVNPGLWGRRLALFRRDNLPAEGFETEEPFSEDWGWVVPVKNQQFRLWIGCGHYQEYPDGFACFIEPQAPFVRRFLKKFDTRERVSALQLAMDGVLGANAGIRDQRWWTHENSITSRQGDHGAVATTSIPNAASSDGSASTGTSVLAALVSDPWVARIRLLNPPAVM
jgi:hypothetical protein